MCTKAYNVSDEIGGLESYIPCVLHEPLFLAVVFHISTVNLSTSSGDIDSTLVATTTRCHFWSLIDNVSK